MVDEPGKEPEKPPEFTEKMVTPEKKSFNIVSIDGVNYPVYEWEPVTWEEAVKFYSGFQISKVSWTDLEKLPIYKVQANCAPVILSPQSIYAKVVDCDGALKCDCCHDREFWTKGCYITVYDFICQECTQICLEKGISVRLVCRDRFVICRKLRKPIEETEE